MADISTVAKQFTDFYYTTFDTNRAGLQGLYVRRTLPRRLTRSCKRMVLTNVLECRRSVKTRC